MNETEKIIHNKGLNIINARQRVGLAHESDSLERYHCLLAQLSSELTRQSPPLAQRDFKKT